MVWLFQCLLCLLKVVYPLVVKETKMKKICAYLFLITTLFSQQEDGKNFKDLSEHLNPPLQLTGIHQIIKPTN